MAETEPAVFTNMCMICDGQGHVLVQNRIDPNWGGIVFPGGHVEPGESFVESVIREIREETGLEIRHPRLCGVKQFPNDEGARYVVLYFKTDEFSGTLRSSEEGEVFWVDRAELMNYPLVPDFPEMLEVFESEDLSEGYYYKEDGQWKVRNL